MSEATIESLYDVIFGTASLVGTHWFGARLVSELAHIFTRARLLAWCVICWSGATYVIKDELIVDSMEKRLGMSNC